MTISRRGLMAVCTAKLVGIRPASSSESDLVAAGKRFDELKVRLDSSEPLDENFWLQFRSMADKLVSARAVRNDEYVAKARAAAWARLGDLDPPRNATLDIRIAVSLLRDIILQNDPGLYQSGALSRMYAQLEEGE